MGKKRKSVDPKEWRKKGYSICWLCRNVMVNCKKPVKGFIANKMPYGDIDKHMYTYIVSECPNFENEWG